MLKHLGLARFCIPFLAVGALHADALYTYSGFDFTTETGSELYLANPRWTTSDSISITADFGSALAPNLSNALLIPLTWSLSVGSSTFTSADGVTQLEDALFSTDGMGNIVDWNFYIIGGGTLFPIISSGTDGDLAGVFGPHFGGSASTTQIGTWSSAMCQVPESGTLVLLLVGFVPLLWSKWRSPSSEDSKRKSQVIS